MIDDTVGWSFGTMTNAVEGDRWISIFVAAQHS